MQKLLLDNGIKWDLICLNIMTVSECGAKGEIASFAVKSDTFFILRLIQLFFSSLLT